MLPTSINTNQRHFDVEPIHEFDFRNRADLIAALGTAIKTGNQMREKPYCCIALIVLPDKAILPTSADTPSRFTISVEPVRVFDYRSKAQFLSALESTIERGLPTVSDPPENELIESGNGVPGFKNPVELKYADALSWDQLERKSIFVSVDCYPSQFLIESWGREPDGAWSDQKLLELRLPPDAGLNGVIDAILEHLTTRTDLPGFTFGLK